ncbi:YifB family Mg chelatase-like AAA ATPase [Botrimarina mediterranea]|uniref:YifB family Mg chelatase-like AAA ATPase n=1 Tax=Botrimarina mediterranea TaxID=2528022 RepID=UPI00118B97FB|nr:Competence protein ComM [Planctomycetes bacterium K2D]
MPRVSRNRSQQTRLEELLRCDHSLNGGILVGLDGFVIEVQARAIEVLPGPISWAASTRISGMTRGAASEVMNRITGAFAKLRIPEPEVAILVNLAPADLFKGGAWLDLPIALILLQAAGHLPDLPENIEGDHIIVGELGIHGEVRRVPGALSLAYVAKAGQKLVVPSGNEKECALIMAKPGHEGCAVYSVGLLEEAIEYFAGKRVLENALKQRISFESHIPPAPDFGQVRGQQAAKDAAMLAAAGGHNLLMIGPPGEGKSMLASAIPGILPKLSSSEKVELTRIYSACGELREDGQAVTRRPMRTVHHTASKVAVVGGGSPQPMPGEITLAHYGVLFMDELAEFPRSTLEAMRQPIEAGEIHISRANGKATFPSLFTLVAAMNPCPCGYYGSDQCRCTNVEVGKYLSKISGPILDRIDLQVELKPLTTRERMAPVKEGESAKLRQAVQAARERQHERFKGTNIPCNAAIPGGEVYEYCRMTENAADHFAEIVDGAKISTRSTTRLAKVSRTVADLSKSPDVEPVHIDHAVAFVIGGLLREYF